MSVNDLGVEKLHTRLLVTLTLTDPLGAWTTAANGEDGGDQPGQLLIEKGHYDKRDESKGSEERKRLEKSRVDQGACD
jgi:hypothetical protein